MAFFLSIASIFLLISTATAIPIATLIAKRWTFHSNSAHSSSRNWNPGWTWNRPTSWTGSWEVGQLFKWTAILFSCMIGGFVLIAIIFWMGGLLDDWRLRRRVKAYGKWRLTNMTEREKAILARRIAAEDVRKTRGRPKHRIYTAHRLRHGSQGSHIDCIAAAPERCPHSGLVAVLDSIASSSVADFGATNRPGAEDTAEYRTANSTRNSTVRSSASGFGSIVWKHSERGDQLPSISTIMQDMEKLRSKEIAVTVLDSPTEAQAFAGDSDNEDATQQADSLQTSSQEIDVGAAVQSRNH